MALLTFEPKIHTAMWGAESWEISALAADPSRESATGTSLDAEFPGFPLLFKVIDAEKRLSVQVHPGDRASRTTGGRSKSEMWCALSDGFVFAGLKPGVDIDGVRRAVETGGFEDILVRCEVRFGDVLYIPAGLIHSIGEGTKIYEVQQSSDTTFRLYDWGRVDASGSPRELHAEKALLSLDCSLPPPRAVRALETPYFGFSQHRLEGGCEIVTGECEFAAVFAARGEAVANGETVLREGSSALVTPCSSCALSSGGSHLFITRFRAPGR